MSKKLTKFQKEYQNECYEDLKATSSSLTKYLVTLSSTFLGVIFFSLPDFIDIFLQKEKEVLLLDLILFSSIGFFLVILISIISGFGISYNLKQGMYFYECPEQERLKKYSIMERTNGIINLIDFLRILIMIFSILLIILFYYINLTNYAS